MKYRPEIDGIRALAVMPVIFFHAGFEIFSGGYLGVDVFFVISGYLITSIIINELDEGKFSLSSFYERRARRILPALFFVILVSVILGLFFLLPYSMYDLSKSIMPVVTFTSNIYFWMESDYFDVASELKPFLHAWSLSVEEQYYIIYPIFLLLAWRFGIKPVIMMLSIAFISSLLFAIWGVYNMHVANFFLLPFRGWELLIGGFCAIYLYKYKIDVSFKLANILGFVGIVMVCVSIFWYTEETPTPSLYTLLPTVGAALLIVFSQKNTFTYFLLKSKPLVAIGLISYSAYLWHHPIFVFAKFSEINDQIKLTPEIYLLLTIIVLLLAFLTWRFIEKPFRTNIPRPKLVLTTSVFFGGVVFLIGYSGYKTNGFEDLIVENRLDKDQKELYNIVSRSTEYDVYKFMDMKKDCHFWVKNTNQLNSKKIRSCNNKHGKALVVLGDSHAMNLYKIISKSDVLPFVIGVTQGGCRIHSNLEFCQYDEFDKFYYDNKDVISDVVYHQSGSSFIEDKYGKVDSKRVFSDNDYTIRKKDIKVVSDYIEHLSDLTNGKVYWLGPFVEYRYMPYEAIYNSKKRFVNPSSIRIFGDLEKEIESVLGVNSVNNYIRFDEFVAVPTSAVINECFIFFDADHFSRCGEDILSKKINLDFLL